MKQESQQNNLYLLNKEGKSLVKYECNKKKKDWIEMMGYTEQFFQWLSEIFAKTSKFNFPM